MPDSMIYVDLNEMVEDDLVMLSQSDERIDSSGNIIKLSAGLKVKIYTDDEDENGCQDNLIGEGVVEICPLYKSGSSFSHVKWCCRISYIIHDSSLLRR